MNRYEEEVRVCEIRDLVDKGEMEKACTALREVWMDGYCAGQFDAREGGAK